MHLRQNECHALVYIFEMPLKTQRNTEEEKNSVPFCAFSGKKKQNMKVSSSFYRIFETCFVA